MTACFQHGANSHLHHYVVQQNSVQQVREVQLPVPVPVHWHECLHLREMPVSGRQVKCLEIREIERLFIATYPGDQWAQHELIQAREEKSRFHLCQSSKWVSPNRKSQLIQSATC